MTYTGPLLQSWIPILTEFDLESSTAATAGQALKDVFGLELDNQHRLVKPDIEGTFAFDKIWSSNFHLFELALQRYQAEREVREYNLPIGAPPSLDALGTDARVAFYALHGMQKAHVITVDPLQVDAIPHWTSISEGLDYGTHARLPFDCIFLDCELPTRVAEDRMTGETRGFILSGALLAERDETLIIVPFGRVSDMKYESPAHGWDPLYAPLGTAVINLHNPADPRDDQAFSNIKHFEEIEGRSLGVDYTLWRTSLSWLLHQIEANDLNKADKVQLYPGPPPQDALDTCQIILNSTNARHKPEYAVHSTLNWGAQCVIATSMVLRILYFLDTPNIEIADAELSRQVRRSAERRGARISQTVWVHHNQKRTRPNPDAEAQPANYSHQFEVRGHWKFYPEGTRTADARPDLLRYVPGRGMCRKIWCPPFVKGPEDAPLVIKTRRLREGTAS